MLFRVRLGSPLLATTLAASGAEAATVDLQYDRLDRGGLVAARAAAASFMASRTEGSRATASGKAAGIPLPLAPPCGSFTPIGEYGSGGR